MVIGVPQRKLLLRRSENEERQERKIESEREMTGKSLFIRVPTTDNRLSANPLTDTRLIKEIT